MQKRKGVNSMTKLQRIQKMICVIPVISTFIVTVITMSVLKKRNSSKTLWLYFYLSFLCGGFLITLLTMVLLINQSLILKSAIAGLLLVVLNLVLIEIQNTAIRQSSNNATKQSGVSLSAWIIFAMLVLVLVVVLSANSPSLEIPDTNGEDDTCVSVITEDMLYENKYSAIRYTSFRKGEHTDIKGRYEDLDGTEVGYTFGKLNGVMPIHVTNATTDSLKLELSSTLESGNLELIIFIDGDIYNRFPANTTETVLLSGINGKIVLIKIAAESAKGTVNIKRDLG